MTAGSDEEYVAEPGALSVRAGDRPQGNPLLSVLEPVSQLGGRLLRRPDWSIQDVFGTLVGHKDRKRLTKAESECGAKQCLTW